MPVVGPTRRPSVQLVLECAKPFELVLVDPSGSQELGGRGWLGVGQAGRRLEPCRFPTASLLRTVITDHRSLLIQATAVRNIIFHKNANA